MKKFKRFINKVLYKLFYPLRKMVNKETSHITLDINNIIVDLVLNADDDYDDLIYKSMVKIREYYNTQELYTKDIILRKKEISGFLDAKFNMMISGILGLFIGALIPNDIFMFKAGEISPIWFIVRLIVYCFLLVFLTARFVENTFTLSEYDKQDLNEYELNIINNILKDRRENKEKEYLITEQ